MSDGCDRAMPENQDFSNLNSWWGAATAEILSRLGVRHAVISPGSRSTPLTFALGVHDEIECHVILDERSAGFYALGLAKALFQPVVLICTSGTAVANYLPAVIEASESGTPLLILTADRPPELRYRHAGQTVDQIKIFGGFVRSFFEAMAPETDLGVLCSWRELLVHAVGRTRTPYPGPVQINCPFREPLAPASTPDASIPEVPDFFFDSLQPMMVPNAGVELPEDLPDTGWIVAGPVIPEEADAYVEKLQNLSEWLGWPVLTDALNPARQAEGDFPFGRVAHYDFILREPELLEKLRPEAIIQIGELPTSKRLREVLGMWQLPTWIVAPGFDSFNAVSAPARVLGCRLEELLIPIPADTGRLSEIASGLLDAEGYLREALTETFALENRLVEPLVARVLAESLPKLTPIFVASSMPVRDAEYFWPTSDRELRVFFNRGANGIDGTLSTALGMAEGLGIPSVLYTGDLALLHDANGFLVANSAFEGSLTIVCIDNHGGGIFEHLPIAKQKDVFEQYWATPQDVDFEQLAAAHGVDFISVESVEALRSVVTELPPSGVRLILIRTDRAHDAAWRRRVFSEISGQLCDLPTGEL